MTNALLAPAAFASGARDRIADLDAPMTEPAGDEGKRNEDGDIPRLF